ncbi:hypothetical protein BLD25_01030 [Candidatus Gracilibacteria bacterium GN02-872]|nr:hypothetical protein BLD25_01030 [Candidatus Gracilibacteria bacterium GN02-872]RKW21461.1 MAG: DNA-binding protein [Candidatus Gracilibacteria bacterium]
MSTMYTYTRQDAADFLGISTRSIDRYIKSGKLRSKKEGKIVYVNDDDIKNLSGGQDSKQEIIDKKPEKKQIEVKEIKSDEKEEKILQNTYNFTTTVPETKEIEVKTNFKTFPIEPIYDDLRLQIKEKDDLIQDLSMKLGRAEEIVKNSVSMIDFKRSQMLLEDSKTHLGSAISELKGKNEELEKKVKTGNITVLVLFITVIVLLVIALMIWVNNI